MKISPLPADHMRAIRKTMNLEDRKDATLWALWLSQCQGVMRGSDILRPTADKKRPCCKDRDTHAGRLIWEEVDPDKHEDCKWRLRCLLKPDKTDQVRERGCEKTFLKDDTEDALSVASAIWKKCSCFRAQSRTTRKLRPSQEVTARKFPCKNLGEP